MIHKKSSKILSLLLCMVMLMTSMPISVFGAGFGNMEALGGYITGGSSSGSGYISNLKSMCGYKISVWYAPLDAQNSTEGEKVYMWNSGTEFQVGRTMYITRDKIQDKDTKQNVFPTFWNTDSIYDQTTRGHSYEEGYKRSNNLNSFTYYSTEVAKDYEIENGAGFYEKEIYDINMSYAKVAAQYLQSKDQKIWTQGDKDYCDFLQRMYNMDNPESIDIYKIDKNTGAYSGEVGRMVENVNTLQLPYTKEMKDKYSKESINYVESYFLNPYVLNMISWLTRSTGSERGHWSVQNFIDGSYKDEVTGLSYTAGQYKIYIEPLMIRPYDSVLGVMSWRDMMVEYLDWVAAGSKGNYRNIQKVSPAVPQIANAMALQAVDTTLKVVDDYLQVSQGLNTNNFDKTINNPLNGLGVGVITSPSLKSYAERPRLIKMYVMLDGVDENGKPIYKKAAETVESDDLWWYTDWTVDGIGSKPPTNIIHPTTYKTEIIPEGVAIANDIFTTDKELVITEDSEWVNTDLPTGVGYDLELSASDIASYRFGLVTYSDLFIERYIIPSLNDSSLLGKLGLLDKYEKALAFFKEELNVDLTHLSREELENFINSVAGDQLMNYFSQATKNEDYIEYIGNLSGTPDKKIVQHYVTSDGELVEMTYDTSIQSLYFNDNGESYTLKVVDSTPLENQTDLKLGMVKQDAVVKILPEDAEDLGIITPPNVLVVRYIIDPKPIQLNSIEVYNETTGKSTYLYSENDLKIENEYGYSEYFSENRETGEFTEVSEAYIKNKKATISNPTHPSLDNIEGDPTLIDWVTSDVLPLEKATIKKHILPEIGDGGKSGAGESREILQYPYSPITHNLYVRWRIVVNDPPEGPTLTNGFRVPEWRLSKFWNAYSEVGSPLATMSIDVEEGCCNSPTLSPSGNWNYNVINPGEYTKFGGLKVDTFIHSRTVKGTADQGGTSSLSLSSPNTAVRISGNINGIKSTDTSGLRVANWIDSGSINGLLSYDIGSSAKGTGYSEDEYKKSSLLNFGVKNIDTYINTYLRYSHSHLYSHCHYSTRGSINITPDHDRVSYGEGVLKPIITFERYNQIDTSSRIKSFESKVSKANNYTTLKYQPGDTLTVYPEYGMLFDNDNNEESIKWVVSDKGRTIKPVVYQTLRHKVYVNPVSSGMTATDTRATKLANTFGADKTKPMLYKGGSVQTAFGVQRDESGKKGMLTVKTFALDIKTNSNGVNVKNEWGNGSYNSQSYHNNLINSLGTLKATAEERLIVGDTKGAILSETTGEYKKVTYNGNTVTTFTHELIVRGGKVIGVRLADRNTGVTSSTGISMSELKTKDDALYEALLNMNLYNEEINKTNTVLDTFEHRTGDNLTEGTYATMLNEARKSIDNIDTPSTSSVLEGNGWYSEDSTVLVVKEYVTNYDVPSISFNDKLSLNYPGLDAPMDKNQLFSKGERGYTYLKYYFPVSVGGVSSDVYFEYDSKSGVNGKQGVDYLVPNVSVTDMTRVN